MEHRALQSRTWSEGVGNFEFVTLRFKQVGDGPVVFYPYSCWGSGYEVPDMTTLKQRLAKGAGRWSAIGVVVILMILWAGVRFICRGLLVDKSLVPVAWIFIPGVYHSVRCGIVARREFKRSDLRLTHTELASAPSKASHFQFWLGVAFLWAACLGLLSGMFYVWSSAHPSPTLRADFGRAGVLIGQCLLLFTLRSVFWLYHPMVIATSTVRRLDLLRWWDGALVASLMLVLVLL